MDAVECVINITNQRCLSDDLRIFHIGICRVKHLHRNLPGIFFHRFLHIVGRIILLIFVQAGRLIRHDLNEALKPQEGVICLIRSLIRHTLQVILNLRCHGA